MADKEVRFGVADECVLRQRRRLRPPAAASTPATTRSRRRAGRCRSSTCSSGVVGGVGSGMWSMLLKILLAVVRRRADDRTDAGVPRQEDRGARDQARLARRCSSCRCSCSVLTALSIVTDAGAPRSSTRARTGSPRRSTRRRRRRTTTAARSPASASPSFAAYLGTSAMAARPLRPDRRRARARRLAGRQARRPPPSLGTLRTDGPTFGVAARRRGRGHVRADASSGARAGADRRRACGHRWRRARALPDPARDGRRRRQDLPHAPGGPAGAGRGAGRRDRLPRAARPARDRGARRGARGRAAAACGRTAALELEEMDVDAVIRRAPELALVDELAHTNAPGMRNEKRYQDIDEVLDAGIDVISTVNVQHLESLNDAIFELTERPRPRDVPGPDPRRGGRGRPRRPRPGGAPASGCAPARSIRRSGSKRRSRTSSARTTSAPSASSRCARSPRTSSNGAGRSSLDPLSQQAVRERVLALIEPQPKSQRILRRAWRSAQRLGREMDALWMRRPGQELTADEATQLAALRRLASILGVHFLEEEGDDLVATVRRVADERGSTYVFVGTPDERAARRDLPRVARFLGWSASSRGSTSASSPTAPCGRNRRGEAPAETGCRPPWAAPSARPVRGRPARPGGAQAAIRIARAEDGVLVPAYLLVVPREFELDAPLHRRGRGRDAAARGGRERCAARRCPGRRADRAGTDADRRPPAALGGRDVRADPRPGRGPRPSGLRARRTSPGCSSTRPSETLILRPAPDEP